MPADLKRLAWPAADSDHLPVVVVVTYIVKTSEVEVTARYSTPRKVPFMNPTAHC